VNSLKMWLLFLVATLSLTHAAILPKGVLPSKSAFYARAKEFQCLDGSARIPYEQVNDDYCDCPDGSDEPGTSACPNGHFYCENRLHTPQLLISSRVNDGICDCCDGSDEYDSGVTCPNTCEELGRSHREEHARMQAVRSSGWEKRKLMVVEGKRMKEEQEAGVSGLKAEKEGMEEGKNAAEKEKNEAEEKEKAVRKVHEDDMFSKRTEKKRTAASLLFNTIDTDLDEKITLEELKKLNYADKKDDGTVNEEALAKFVGENGEADIEHFITNSFFSVRQMRRDHIANEKREKEEKEHGEDNKVEKMEEVEAVQEGVEKHGEDEEDIEEDAAVEEEVDEFDDNVPFVAFSDEDNKVFDAAREARQKYDDIKRKMDDIDRQITDAESFSGVDFGADLAWAPLKGKCSELEMGEYVYKLCPFDRCTQKEKHGHSETNMGTWKGWETGHSEMKYADGTTCWNGPARSTMVQVECGDEDQLVEASEPGRCEYHFTFRTPAACTDPAADEVIHSEL
ncbi:hypothetical protein PMAYCL1PPCAC_33224, partial [Pristionchus mayeri]